MALTTTELSAVATAESTKFGFISLHTADPGSTGTGEATGGAPAYARKPVTFTVSNGVATGVQVTFDVAAGTYPYFGLWSAATGGTFYGGNPLAVSQTVSSQGQVKVTVTLTVTGS